ncbi:hypothetical protein, partial [Sinorhizobium meliloti]|uniref:hypothetical protein n=1 Tax=Rhizobium meliloti TaxID=382 RepID=UPI001AEC840E
GRLVMVSPVSGIYAKVRQKFHLSPLFKFPEPALFFFIRPNSSQCRSEIIWRGLFSMEPPFGLHRICIREVFTPPTHPNPTWQVADENDQRHDRDVSRQAQVEPRDQL